ncbi:sperm acrosome membrane-associated protein 4-like [Mugil cephalus]|uniref:sperm acrosome membrane-associated protein 4-like n=1 Tax=Mugil cephalus TaxID=48193 RepID=UPI001FB5D851|nr:sperm acrosome membrane-associated protein 4-like [Mugil cephalus]
MSKLLWRCAALLTLFIAVQCLQCNTCDFKIFGQCVGRSPVNCTGDENRCYTGVAKFTGALMDIHARGCIEAFNCTNQTGQILTVNYTITRTCCSGDLCNGAAPVQMPLTAALCAALVAVWSQWSL